MASQLLRPCVLRPHRLVSPSTPKLWRPMPSMSRVGTIVRLRSSQAGSPRSPKPGRKERWFVPMRRPLAPDPPRVGSRFGRTSANAPCAAAGLGAVPRPRAAGRGGAPANLCGVDLVHASCLLRSCSHLAFVSIVPGRDGHIGRRTVSRLRLWSYSVDRVADVFSEVQPPFSGIGSGLMAQTRVWLRLQGRGRAAAPRR